MRFLQFTQIARLMLFAFALPAGAQTMPAAGPNSPVRLTADPIYQKHCSKCHGKNAEGKHLFGGPSLISGKVTTMAADDLRDIITNGKGHMPKFTGKLTNGEIDALLAQIKAASTATPDPKP